MLGFGVTQWLTLAEHGQELKDVNRRVAHIEQILEGKAK